MVPGIDPKIDYAFKRLFGRDENRPLLIHLLNAVLSPRPGYKILDLEILNPFNDKDALDDKLSILDVKARDQQGRQFNVEMQMLAEVHWSKRILYYWAKLYQQQLHEGEGYPELRPTVSVCFLNARLFEGVPEYHLRFRLLEDRRQVALTEDLEIHLLELPKFAAAVEQVAEPLDRWLYFLRHADILDAQALPKPLQVPEIQQAMQELTKMSQNDVERERYEARVKAHRDAISLVKGAELRGREEGRAEGLLVGRIHLCLRLLKRPLPPADDLLSRPAEELQRLAEQLEKEVLG